ncbi:MAG: GFA family protein [Rhodobacteraceae bacterium]|nr:GFA family protein [Paracoccaceae bacterium]
MFKGSCLCGSVTFRVTGNLTPPSACHCGQCRKQSGHFWSATNANDADFELITSDSLRWFSASDIAKRGFCSDCGSFLLWKRTGSERISISMGSFDDPTRQTLARHIFVADKGDYYQITDSIAQLETS